MDAEQIFIGGSCDSHQCTYWDTLGNNQECLNHLMVYYMDETDRKDYKK